jgi:hypothetical protein
MTPSGAAAGVVRYIGTWLNPGKANQCVPRRRCAKTAKVFGNRGDKVI